MFRFTIIVFSIALFTWSYMTQDKPIYLFKSAVEKKPVFEEVTRVEGAYFDITDSIDEGLLTGVEFEHSWSEFLGIAPGVDFDSLKLQGDFKLTAIAGEFLTLTEDPLRVLITHTWDGLEDQTSTFYSREINGLEEQNVTSAFSAPTLIRMGDAPEVLGFERNARIETKLETSQYSRQQSFRIPKGHVAINLDGNLDDTLMSQLLMDPSSYFEGQYEGKLMLDDKIHTVRMVLRQPQLDLLTLEVQIQEEGSLTIRSYALKYEKIKEHNMTATGL